MRRKPITLVFLLCFCSIITAQHNGETIIKSRLADFFRNYHNPAISNTEPCRLDSVRVDTVSHSVSLFANSSFAAQSFTKETIQSIRNNITQLLPAPYNAYNLKVYANRTLMEELSPLADYAETTAARSWNNITNNSNPWVLPVSAVFEAPAGLQGRHVSVSASHGRYFDVEKNVWKWQRPRLFCTTEDLFTQSIVVPFLIPMLENAGAIVFTPRERDMNKHEVIVDNDRIEQQGEYIEKNGVYEWQDVGIGFGNNQGDVYLDSHNPFLMGTCRGADTQTSKRQTSSITWTPSIPADGQYAVYVSYKSLPNSVSDALYIVRHNGINTQFHVNQQIGGGTWVYLGTFDFRAGQSSDNCIVLTNQSNYRGVITADAVRLGGGMGNIARWDSIHAPVRSGVSRYLEGSRYTAQWYGVPYKYYSTKNSINDYGDDINARSLMTNYVTAGSCIMPGDTGLCVPIEMSVAVHSDAGTTADNTPIGTLGIYTTGKFTDTRTDFEGWLAEGLFPSNLSRLTSRDLCDIVMTQVDNDLRHYNGQWNRRQLFDKNYSESREPCMPSMILETLSHQNFADMLIGHDPVQKFRIARAIYKGMLRFSAQMHKQEEVIVQPLPVQNFSALLDAVGDSVCLSWEATPDEIEATARPDYYILYKSEGDLGYDNGTRVESNKVTLPVNRGKLTRFRVTAANRGGQSMVSEELSVFSALRIGRQALIINGFQRMAAPQPVHAVGQKGFDMNQDPGVVYQKNPCFCGKQFDFSSVSDSGNSGSEYEDLVVAGNTWDFPTRYGKDIIAADSTLSFSSCSRGAVEADTFRSTLPDLLVVILGAQRSDGYSQSSQPCFTPNLRDFIQTCSHNHISMLVSGAYIGEDVGNLSQESFLQTALHCQPSFPHLLTDTTAVVQGMGAEFSLEHEANERSYSTRRVSVLTPTSEAFTCLTYPSSVTSAAVAYAGADGKTLTFGFPLEMIRETEVRRGILGAALSFLLTTNP
ncbi:MAG: hypothetical protein HUK02_02255 [Bacteroidaceae bacterium]|nr:hypothetical protein [Bacteroidaceae bacterium]